MANGLQLNQSTAIGGLETQTFVVAIAGNYTCSVNVSIPHIAAGSQYDSSSTVGTSELEIVVNLEGDPLLTLDSPSTTQTFMGGSVQMVCEVGDEITIEFSSSAAADNQANAIKGMVNLYQGF